MEQRIPKLIHYCWLGDNKPNFILRRCIISVPLKWDELNN